MDASTDDASPALGDLGNTITTKGRSAGEAGGTDRSVSATASAALNMQRF
jgi:hypothetical protein